LLIWLELQGRPGTLCLADSSSQLKASIVFSDYWQPYRPPAERF